ncbi:MerR family transcriptional regulator [Corynebacterium flavescens]|uniref:MerR family transcriptional regulator n=1 Tax=Corynebacterium flavescens TaxID=28028 RepID=UPI003FCFFDA4
MATRALIEELLDKTGADPQAPVIDIVHALIDASPTEPSPNLPVGISEAAGLVGLSAHTLRYYEDEGLVAPARDAAGYRRYGDFDLRRLVFLTRMRLSGMGMAELKRYVALVEQGESSYPERREIMMAQRARIQRQLRELLLALEVTEYKIEVYTPEVAADARPQG